MKKGERYYHSIDAVDAKDCIFNLQSISQARRRRFNPGLPLGHFFFRSGVSKSTNRKWIAGIEKTDVAYSGKCL